MNKKYDYFVVGDYEVCGKIQGCLIYVCGTDEEHAKKVLENTVANPPKECLGNIRLEKELSNDCWWNEKLN